MVSRIIIKIGPPPFCRFCFDQLSACARHLGMKTKRERPRNEATTSPAKSPNEFQDGFRRLLGSSYAAAASCLHRFCVTSRFQRLFFFFFLSSLIPSICLFHCCPLRSADTGQEQGFVLVLDAFSPSPPLHLDGKPKKKKKSATHKLIDALLAATCVDRRRLKKCLSDCDKRGMAALEKWDTQMWEWVGGGGGGG